MAIGESKYVNTLFQFIDDQSKTDIENFILNSLMKNYEEFTDLNYVQALFTTSNDLSEEELLSLRQYSGTDFRHINSALRDTWTYEKNGNISNKQRYEEDGRNISKIISDHPTYCGNFKAYRGVSIGYFKDYGITSLEDLETMRGKFMFDRGFISTSLIEKNCFFQKENTLGLNYNVKIEYLIPDSFGDGMYLGNNTSSSYNPEQSEYLINAGNMSRVTNVKIEGDTAVLTAVMIPKSIYDEYYKHQNQY